MQTEPINKITNEQKDCSGTFTFQMRLYFTSFFINQDVPLAMKSCVPELICLWPGFVVYHVNSGRLCHVIPNSTNGTCLWQNVDQKCLPLDPSIFLAYWVVCSKLKQSLILAKKFDIFWRVSGGFFGQYFVNTFQSKQAFELAQCQICIG